MTSRTESFTTRNPESPRASVPSAVRTLVSDCAAVFARFGAAVEHVGAWIDDDSLESAAVAGDEGDVMAPAAQLGEHLFRESALSLELAASSRGSALWRRGIEMLHAGRFAGLLDVHAEVDQVAEDLNVALRLHVASHHPKGQPGF